VTVSFELPIDLEERLRQEAGRAGLDMGEYVRRFLANYLSGVGDSGRAGVHSQSSAGARLDAREADLLSQINLGLPPELWEQYRELLRKRDDETLAAAEQRQLVALSDQIEQANARRMAHVAELARLRGVGIKALMVDLGLGGGKHG
jgi:hypothetical protein